MFYQGVNKVNGSQPQHQMTVRPMKTVTLSFKIAQLPREVIMAHEIFPVKEFIPRPALYPQMLLWYLNTQKKPAHTHLYKQCSQNHPLSDFCKTPLKCPTWAKSGHAAGTSECAKYSNMKQIMKFAYEKRILMAEVNKPGPARSSQRPKMHSTANPDQEIYDLKKLSSGTENTN